VAAVDVEVAGPVTLGEFVKYCGAAATGGQAKRLVQGGAVRVNGRVETRRGHRLAPGDVVAVGGREYRVCTSSP
jgi:ribosome-associated protein